MPQLVSWHEYLTNPQLKAVQDQAESTWADQHAEDTDDDGTVFTWARCTGCAVAFASYRGESVREDCK